MFEFLSLCFLRNVGHSSTVPWEENLPSLCCRAVPLFENMDERLRNAICERLKPCLNTNNTYIVREGDPVDEMLFIIHGSLECATTDGGRSGFFNSGYLKEGDLCGEELLTWALDRKSGAKALREVEAFTLPADKLKFLLVGSNGFIVDRLPNALDMEIYLMYGVGIPTVQAYIYKLKAVAECYIPFQIDTSTDSKNEDGCLKDGVYTVDGDETVPALSVGFMCAKGWHGKTRFNPSRIKTYIREYDHNPPHTTFLRVVAHKVGPTSI